MKLKHRLQMQELQILKQLQNNVKGYLYVTA